MLRIVGLGKIPALLAPVMIAYAASARSHQLESSIIDSYTGYTARKPSQALWTICQRGEARGRRD